MERPTDPPPQAHEGHESKSLPPEGANPVAVSVVADAAAAAPNSNKRKTDIDGFKNSEYCKVRAIVKELRPFFMEVMDAPDFRESKAADEIRKRMKTMMELTKQLTETASTLKPSIVPEQQLNGAVMKENADKKVELEKQSKEPRPSKIQAASISISTGNAREQKGEAKSTPKFGGEGLSRGSFVVGGSPIGWNFLMYRGSKLLYYGRTK
ncbi:hypothetical protein KSP39_PZI008654 [Platanthera zijinensis]|uniref:Uncharacterized protein n=1 Tax=Platanthera zijinensis TaxID=2320716 RepID=A0AAP0G8Z4_9ASPA